VNKSAFINCSNQGVLIVFKIEVYCSLTSPPIRSGYVSSWTVVAQTYKTVCAICNWEILDFG